MASRDLTWRVHGLSRPWQQADEEPEELTFAEHCLMGQVSSNRIYTHLSDIEKAYFGNASAHVLRLWSQLSTPQARTLAHALATRRSLTRPPHTGVELPVSADG